jgi:choline dehydrogenase-like flavoprotein
VLPAAQSAAGGGLQVLADCRVEKLVVGDGRAQELICRLGDGRPLQVTPNEVVLAAGAIDSSALLRASHLGGERVGTGIGFNVSAVLAIESSADAGRDPDRWYAAFPEHGFAIEFGLDPSQLAVAGLPSSFIDYAARAETDPRWQIASVTVAATPNASLPASGDPLAGFDFQLRDEDRKRLVEGVVTVADAALAQPGAVRALVAAPRRIDLRPERQVSRALERLSAPDSMALVTNEPQGGNAMSRDAAKGVVDPTLRVRGIDNLCVCDASVFPSPLGVYSQLAVMALAELAAEDIATGRWEPAPPEPEADRQRRRRGPRARRVS